MFLQTSAMELSLTSSLDLQLPSAECWNDSDKYAWKKISDSNGVKSMENEVLKMTWGNSIEHRFLYKTQTMIDEETSFSFLDKGDFDEIIEIHVLIS